MLDVFDLIINKLKKNNFLSQKVGPGGGAYIYSLKYISI